MALFLLGDNLTLFLWVFYHFLGVLKLAWVTPKSKEKKKSHRIVPEISRLQVIGKSIFSTHTHTHTHTDLVINESPV